MSNNPAKYEVLIKQYLCSILDIRKKICFGCCVVSFESCGNCNICNTKKVNRRVGISLRSNRSCVHLP